MLMIMVWTTPRARAVAYSLLGSEILSVVLLLRDGFPPNVAKAEGSLEELVGLFEGWDSLLMIVLLHVNKVDKWPLMYFQVKQPRNSQQGTFTMVGDSCHPILTHMAAS